MAINSVSKAVRRARVGLKADKKPIASFIFAGPTGVGKTQLAKALTEFMFGSKDFYTRLDMSEYMEKHSVARLIGSPPGYVGYQDGGQLTEAVRQRPYNLILFDEVEKAHPDIFNIFLQMLDDGRLTDNHGKLVKFNNCLIILTSNLGSSNIEFPIPKVIGVPDKFGWFWTEEGLLDWEDPRPDDPTWCLRFHPSEKEEEIPLTDDERNKLNREKIIKSIKEYFRPEFINRLDELIVFDALTYADASEILNLMLDDLKKRLEKELDISLEYEDNVRYKLLRKGYQAEYGARPMRRALSKYLENLLTEGLLDGVIMEGDKIHIQPWSIPLRDKEPLKDVLFYIDRILEPEDRARILRPEEIPYSKDIIPPEEEEEIGEMDQQPGETVDEYLLRRWIIWSKEWDEAKAKGMRFGEFVVVMTKKYSTTEQMKRYDEYVRTGKKITKKNVLWGVELTFDWFTNEDLIDTREK